MTVKFLKYLGIAWIIQFVVFVSLWAVSGMIGETASWHTVWMLFITGIPFTIMGFIFDKKKVKKE